MDIAEAYTILRNGDSYLMKEYLERNAGDDPALATSIVSSLRKELNKAKYVSIVLFILGIPLLLLLGFGLLPIGIGVWRFIQYKRGTRVLNDGYKLFSANTA